MSKTYRKCVGLMILNKNKEILVGKRIDHPSGFWQMPQGGIDKHEKPEDAIWREMMEEIGTNKAKLIKKSNQSVNQYQEKQNNGIGIFSFLIVLVISVAAIILLLDTFKHQLISFFPNLDNYLVYIFETLNNIYIIIKDLFNNYK